MKKGEILLWMVAVLVSLPAVFSYLKPGFFHLHDFTHVARLAEMHRALSDGHFPVRWSQNLGWGYGLPQFSFYGPLPYTAGAALVFLGFSYVFAVKAIVIVTFIVSFGFMYRLASGVWGRWGGVLAALVYTYLPYRAVNAYSRGAIGELWGMMFAIMALYFGYRLIMSNKRRDMMLLAVSVAGLFLSHNLTALIVTPLLLVWMGLVLGWQGKLGQWWKAWLGVLWGGLVAAFYVVPMYFEKDLTMANKLTQGFSDFHHHFLYLRQLVTPHWGYGGSVFGLEDNMSFEIGNLMVVLALVGGLNVLLVKKERRVRLGWLIASGLVAIVAILMTTFKTEVIWENVSLLAFIQFPWRFMVIITPLAAFMAGSAGLWLKQKSVWRGVLVSGLVFWLLMRMYGSYFKPEAYLGEVSDLYYPEPERISREMSGVIPDFLPLTASELPLEVPESRFEISSGEGDVAVVVNRTHEFMVEVNHDGPVEVTINILYYPGWQFYVNGNLLDLPLFLGEVITIPLSGGDFNRISGRFNETPLRSLSNLISLSAVGLLIWFSTEKMRKGTHAQR